MAFFDWLGALPGAAAQGIIWGIMAIGVYITYKILDVADLTVDGSICTGGAVCAVLVTSGVNVWVALAVATVAGILCGLLTGFFHTFMGIPAILAGILTQLILWSVNLKIMGQANLAVPSRAFKVLIAASRVPKSLLVLAGFMIVLIAVLYWFFGTEMGASLRATGSNIQMSRAQGINTELNKIFGLALSNGVVALSGALLTQYQGFADINMGRGAIVIGLASVIIGEAVTARFAKNFAVKLLGVILGGVIYYFVYQTVVFLGLDTDLLKMLSAIVVAIFLAVPYWKKRYFSNPKKKEEKRDA
ncbi:MAG: ABC transporter permease [Clostridia bacterium]|nr:ABC transporter permease [Clostridia bacterium]